MLIWRGHGYLVPVLMFLSALVTNYVFDRQFQRGYYFAHSYTIGISFFLGAVAAHFIARWLVNRSQERVYIDKETNEEVVFVSRHDFFFIPVYFWSFIFAAVGVVLVAMELFS